jgi:LmbE family N-acetylglucosaminyl deacetylase
VSKRALILFGSLCLLVAPRLSAQERGAAALGELIEGLGTTARVLMIGAHPDDEDTQLIAWLATGRHVETAYLSLTRGDGGQNLIGNELGEPLGMIRTEELLAARRIDGGRQYFTRAFDFGFSKTIDETFQHWPRDVILRDMVAIVRAYRPQVIISVWSGTPADGHGHHQYAGVLAREVFDAAGDSVRFPPSTLGGLKPWMPLKFYRSARFGRGGVAAAGNLVRFNVGEFDPLLGESYSEIATVSRSQHRSQGQGGLPQRGAREDAVRLETTHLGSAPSAPERTIFDGIDTSWARFASLRLADSVRAALDSLPGAQAVVARLRDLAEPARMVAPLAVYVRLATRAANGITCTTLESSPAQPRTCDGTMGDLALALELTRERASEALLDAGGVSIQATAPREVIAESDSIPVTISVFNEGREAVRLDRAAIRGQRAAAIVGRTILLDSTAREVLQYRAGADPTRSWWLVRPRVGDMFNIDSTPHPTTVPREMIEGADRIESSAADVTLTIDGTEIPVEEAPIVYRYADPARGEVRRPIATVPAVTVLLEHEVEYARANAPFDRTMLVDVHSAETRPLLADVSLVLPAGLRADSAERHLSLPPGGDVQVYFRVQGRLSPGRHPISAVARVGARQYTEGFIPIEYEHIRPLRYYRPATVQIQAVDAGFANLRIGYIRGVGDNVMPMLEELGLPVTELDPATLARTNLSAFTTIVLGSRAYEASPALLANTPVLMQFARNGGTIVTQYGQYEMARAGVLPYPITLARPADRVTDEYAVVRVLDPGSPLLSTPNKITEADFANWVQERSSYMPHTFDRAYRDLFSMHDPGEPPNDAAVLVAPVGKGTYVYTTFSFFRQLPAGNPGAARLFINLLSANQSAANRPASASDPIRP